MSLISTPLFKTNGKEELLSTDVYKLTDSIPINKVFEAAKNVGGKLFDAVGGREGLVSGVTQLIVSKSSGATGKELLSQGLSMFGTSKETLLRTAGDGILDKAGEYIDLDPSVMSKVKVTVGEVSRGMVNDRDGQIDTLFSVLKGLTGNPDLISAVNIGMEAAVWGSTISKAVEYNFPDIIKQISQSVDPETLRWSMIYASSTVMSQGDLDSLITTLETLTPEEVLGNNEDFIKNFLRAFQVREDWDASVYPEKGLLLDSTLKKLDPKWALFTRMGGDIVNFAPLATASTDARKLLTFVPYLKEPIQVAPDFPVTTTYAILQSMYPMSVASLK